MAKQDDGFLDGSFGSTIDWQDGCSSVDARIGSRMGQTHFDGQIDEVRIYDSAFSEVEIQRDMASAYPITRPRGSWSFEDITGGITHDTHHIVEGACGGAGSFDGVDDAVAIQNYFYDTAGEIEELTACSWVKSSTTADAIVVAWDRSEYWRLALKDIVGTGNVGWATTDSTDCTHDMTLGTNYADGEWHLICGWFSSLEIPDKKSDDEWVEHVLELVGPVDKLWTGKEEIAKLWGENLLRVLDEVQAVAKTMN